jgi:hypothetical protein
MDLTGSLLYLLVLSTSISVPPLVLSAAIVARRDTEASLLSVQEKLSQKIEQANLALDSAKRHFQILIEGVVDYTQFS